MSPGRVPLRSAADALTPPLVKRFRVDLAALLDDPANDRLLVAVSGGPDSVALLLLAHAVIGERCIAATVDHGLRSASAAEAAMVAELCRSRGISHRTLIGELPPRAGRTANLSARARMLRYGLLEEERVRVRAAAIATGHHADDQLETMVMRLDRGAGVAGLAGVRARSERIVRPLLSWRRAELAAIVAAAGIAAAADPSNVDDRFDRARLRKRLDKVHAFDIQSWGRSARALGDAEDAIAWSAARLAGERIVFAEAHADLDASGIPFELQRRLVENCLRHVQPAIEPRGDATARLVRALAEGRTSMLGNVRASVTRRGGGRLWTFAAAPPRRAR